MCFLDIPLIVRRGCAILKQQKEGVAAMEQTRNIKRLFFNESWDTYFKLRNIGYHDFHIIAPTKFARIYDWFALHYIVSGKGTLIIRDKKYRLCAGDFFYIPANEPTTYYADENEPWCYYWISFSPSSRLKISDILKLSTDFPTRTAKNPQRVTELFDTLFALEVSPSEFCYMTMSAIMQLFASEAIHPTLPIPQKVSPQKAAATIKQIIELNYANPNFNTNDISTALYLSTRQVDRIFKNETGMTPRMYLVEVRLHHAAKLLEENDYKVKDLCRLVGIYDEFHFMKIFKGKFGLTVKEYRKQFAENETNL